MNLPILKEIAPPDVELFNPFDESLGIANEYEFLDFRVQIKRLQVSGYYVKWKGRKIAIDCNGQLEDYPDGLLSLMGDFYLELLT